MSDMEGHWLCTGTTIRTSSGNRPIEALAVGDRIVTSDGAQRTITGLSSQLIDCTWHPDSLQLMPIQIVAHTFGMGRPFRDMFVSRNLPIILDFAVDTLVPLSLLINGATIRRTHALNASYWQIELDLQSTLIADGLTIMSYKRANNYYPHVKNTLSLQEQDAELPLTKWDRQTVADTLRWRINTQALGLGWTLDDSPVDLRICIGDAIVKPRCEGTTLTFCIPGDADDALLVCATSCPNDVAQGGDGRELGVCLAGIRIADDASPPKIIALDDPRLCIGFFPLEPNGLRWTTGHARLPAELWRDRPNGCSLTVDLVRPSLPRWSAPAGKATPETAIQHRRASSETIFFWCDETVRQIFETGIQRVTRQLWRGLEACGVDVLPVGWDWRRRAIVTLGCAAYPGGVTVDQVLPRGSIKPWLFVPELSLTLAAAGLDPLQLAQAYGFRTAAVLHDVIPFKLPHLYDAEFLHRFRRYFEMFASATITFVGTDYVANDLHTHLEGMGYSVPEIAVIPFAAQLGNHMRRASRKPARDASEPLRLLTISTFEPRKNLPNLLDAIRRAQSYAKAPIELAVVGHRVGAAAYEAEVQKLCAGIPGVTLHAPMDDDHLAHMFEACHASIYPSCEEGFGLPIVESLWLATPAICHFASAMEEIARGGGVLTMDMRNPEAIAQGLVDISLNENILTKLSDQALTRALDSWSGYAARVEARLRGAAPAEDITFEVTTLS